MAWPTVAVDTTGMDADTDNLPRIATLDLTTKFNELIAMRALANGVCDLDASALVPIARIPATIARLAGAALTGTTSVVLLNHAVGANIASAATINLTTATGNLTHITGAVDISAVTLGSGMMRAVIFDGGLVLNHDVTTNNLPGGLPITTAAGDRAVYWADGVTVWCVAYIRANGTAVVGSGGVGAAIINNAALTLTSTAHNTRIIRCTTAGAVWTFPAASTNSGMYVWMDNATSSDTGVRLLSNGGTIGGAAAAGTTNYIPAYTIIGFQSDGTNWAVFAKTPMFWSFNAGGTWYCPPGVYSITVDGSGGGAAGGADNTNTSGGGSSGARVNGTKLTAVPGTAYVVAIGAGGAGAVPNSDGAGGGATSLGAILILSGGAGGTGTGVGGIAPAGGLDGTNSISTSPGTGGGGTKGGALAAASANSGAGAGAPTVGAASTSGGSGYLRVRA